MSAPFCSFCAINGFAGPHDHFVRADRAANAKVTCPKLLATECGFCHKFGHTAKFCSEAKEQELFRRSEKVKTAKASFASGDWVTVGAHLTASNKSIECVKVQTPNGFSILDIDGSNENISDEVKDSAAGSTWADLVRTPYVAKPDEKQKDEKKKDEKKEVTFAFGSQRPKGISWGEWVEDDE
jgi:hypothetical protein